MLADLPAGPVGPGSSAGGSGDDEDAGLEGADPHRREVGEPRQQLLGVAFAIVRIGVGRDAERELLGRVVPAFDDEEARLGPQLAPQGPGHMSQPALLEMTSSSRRPPKSSRRMRPTLVSADPYGGP